MQRSSKALIPILVIAAWVAAAALPASAAPDPGPGGAIGVAATASSPTITITPDTYVGNQGTRLQLSGFAPGASVDVSECVLTASPSFLDDCSGGLGVGVDATGAYSDFVDAPQRWIYSPTAGWSDCVVVACAYEAIDTARFTDPPATASIHFTPLPPPATRGTITLSPTSVPRPNNSRITVSGSGFRPGVIVRLAQCVAGPTHPADCDRSPGGTLTDASGSFSGASMFTFDQVFTTNGVTSCRVSASCSIAAWEELDFVGTVVSQPIRLDVTVVPGAVTAPEGDAGTSTIAVPVRLTNGSDVPVTVDWSTVSSPAWDPTTAAQPGVDYNAASGTLTFAPGTTDETVPIQVLGDPTPEQNELIVVQFHDATNATIGGLWGLGFATIADDDAPTIVPGAANVAEGDAGTTVLQIPVHLAKPPSTTVTVDWATAFSPSWDPTTAAQPGVDYTPASGTLTFAPGTTDLTVPVSIRGDTTPEQNEVIIVVFTNPVGARVGGVLGLGFGGITNDDTPS